MVNAVLPPSSHVERGVGSVERERRWLLRGCRIATAPAICCAGHAAPSRSSNASSPTHAIKDQRWRSSSAILGAGHWRSLSAAMRIASSSCPNDGSSSVPSPGSAASPPGTRFRALLPHRRSLRPPRNDPADAQAIDQANPFFLTDHLLDRLQKREPSRAARFRRPAAPFPPPARRHRPRPCRRGRERPSAKSRVSAPPYRDRV